MASQNISSLISSVYKARTTILDLMKIQGYSTNDYSEFSVNEVNTMKLNNQLDMILEKKDDDQDIKKKRKIYIRFYLAKSLRPANLHEMIDDIFNVEELLSKDDTLFIIVKDEVNETLLNTLKHIWEKDKIFIVIYPLKRLQFNILEHVLVPPHRVISNAETNTIRTKYNIMSDYQFPELSRFDPVAQAIGIRPGQVCEIIRPSKTAISSLYYRICV